MSIDVNRIKEQVDCRHIVERDLGQPKYHNDKYNTYRCPLHNEQNGYSLVVYHDHWHCFGKCNRGGDVISWMQEYHDVSFQDACEQLSIGEVPQLERNMKRETRIPRSSYRLVSEPPSDEWQAAATQIAQQARETLRSRAGVKARNYLTNRGLSEQTISEAGLGYIPGDYRDWKTIHGLKVPCGITIPWIANGVLWGIKVRRAAGEQRYHQVGGGNIKGSLYLADEVIAGQPIILTEGEFDALIAKQIGQGLISAVSIGSASNKYINPRWFPKFICATSLYILMDSDSAGNMAASHIEKLSQAAYCVHVPQGKDINEFYQLVGHDAAQKWVTEQVVAA